ncbi:unnamed protein product, partial [Iphiclides podalirius]
MAPPSNRSFGAERTTRQEQRTHGRNALRDHVRTFLRPTRRRLCLRNCAAYTGGEIIVNRNVLLRTS